MNVNGFELLRGRKADDLKRTGFTVVELLVVLACVGILAVTLLPALAATKLKTVSAECLSNYRQLGMAWLQYTGDHQDKLVTNADKTQVPAAAQNWICSYGVVLDWSASHSNNTNTVFLSNPTYSLMAPYVGKSVSIFLCPADHFVSSVQASLGWTHRLRSCAMDGALGDGSKWFGAGHGGASAMPQYYNALKLSDLRVPGPSKTWVVTDEHPDSDDDACLYVDPANWNGSGTYNMLEFPGSMHDGAAGMDFADGHAEIHRWQSSQTVVPVRYLTYVQGATLVGDQDLVWWAQHTPRNPKGP